MFLVTASPRHSVGPSLLVVLDVLPEGCTPRLYYVVPNRRMFNRWKHDIKLPDSKVTTDTDDVPIGWVSDQCGS